MSYVVLTHPELDGARIVVHVDALPEHTARDWDVVGPCSDRSRDPLLSDDEQAAHDADLAARVAELAALATSTDADDDPVADDTIPTDDTAAAAADPQE